MEEVPPHFHPQTSLQPSSLYTTRISSQFSATLPQEFPTLDERLNYSMNLACAEPHPMFPPGTSQQGPTISINNCIMPPDHASAHNFSSFRQNNVPSQSQVTLLVLGEPFDQQRPAQFLTRKRAPKAPTMFAKNWKPHKNRIRQLYVSDGKPLKNCVRS
jgi:hypothetical protein